MNLNIDDQSYKVEIIKKSTTKNTYIRIKSDLTISVTTNIFVSDNKINKILVENLKSIKKMIEKEKNKNKYKDENYYLGKKYDLVYINDNKVLIGEEKIFIGREIDFNKWLKKQATILFKERLDFNYEKFSKKIPYPTLTIRKMTSRWGVCNTKAKRVTLNLELIKKDIECLDYVIIHELSHLIHQDHSKNFWSLVGENCPNYKKIRKQMKEY